MTAGNLCVGIMGVQIDIREYPVISVPSANVRFFGRKLKLSAHRLSAFDRQRRVLSLILLLQGSGL